MNKYLIQLNNIAKSLKDLLKVNPHKHWKFLLYVFLILLVILVLFSFYLLYQINNEKVFQVKIDDGVNKIILNENVLKKVINTSDLKASKELEIKTKGTPYKDPSI